MNVGDWIQVVVTTILVCITGWYAWETRRMVKNMEKDREELHRPVLNFQLIAWEANSLKLRIMNVGSGVATDIDGKIESKNMNGLASFPWSYPSLISGQYQEFGFPVINGGSTQDRFNLNKIRENVSEVEARFKYKSTNGLDYELNEIISIKKVTDDWVASKMLVTQDHPDRIMARIAKALEAIKEELRKQ